MSYKEQIKKYDVDYYAGGKTANGFKYRAIVGLRRADGNILGAAYFHRSPDTMPNTDHRSSNGYVYCHYRWEDFPHVLDMLRNEKPVYLRYVAGSWNLASIDTSQEPIGEGEEP